MALNKLVKRLNLESETVDISDVEDQTVEDVVEQDVASSDLQDATDELKELAEDFEEGEVTADELQEAIDHTKEVLAEAESKAEENGEEAEVPVEEIVAAQESLRYFYKQIGLDPSEMVTVSREDIHTNSLQAYKELQANLESVQVSLEGIMGDMVDKAKETLKKAATKLKAFLGNMPATAQVLKKEIESLPNDVDPEKAKAVIEKNFAKCGFAADVFKNGDISAVIAYADNAQKLVKNVVDNNKDATTGIQSVNLSGRAGAVAKELLSKYASEKYSAVTAGTMGSFIGSTGYIITFVDAKDPGIGEIVKNAASSFVGYAKAIKSDAVKPYAPEGLVLSKALANKYIDGLLTVSKRYDTVFKETGGIFNLLFGTNALKVIVNSDSGDAGVKGTVNNYHRAHRIGINAASTGLSVAASYVAFVNKYVSGVIKAAK